MGLFSAVPGIHISVLLLGLLPLLSSHQDAGACLVVSAMASGLISTILAKTFHPATQETLKQATPEQLLAYRGQGRKAIDIQLQSVWTACIVTCAVTIPLLTFHLCYPKALKELFNNTVAPFTPLLLAVFILSTVFTARRKVLTILAMSLAGLIGFVALNHPNLAGSEAALAPLLAGVFSIPPLLQVMLHTGKIKNFPKQHNQTVPARIDVAPGLGAVAGIATSVGAGLGSGALVSSFASLVEEESYLAMHTASETSNNLFSVFLFIILGMSHAGSAIAIKRSTENPDVTLGVLLILCAAIGITAGTCFITRSTNVYIAFVQRIPQRLLAFVVLCTTLGLLFHETGIVGLYVAGTTTFLGLLSRSFNLPNQAMSGILTGPVIIYHSGLSPVLSQLFHVAH
jgi:TctA family transporter